MSKITNDEIKKAYQKWLYSYDPYHYTTQNCSQRLEPYLAPKIRSASFPTQYPGWIRHTRRGLQLSRTSLAKKLKVSRITYSQYEEGEENGSISLLKISQVAEALDCEFVYAIRPKNKKSISQIIWEKLLPLSLQHPWLNKCDQKRRSDALAAIARNWLTETKFRKSQGWSQRMHD